MATKNVSAFRLSEEAAAMLKAMAESENRNLSNMAEVSIREAFAKRKLKLPEPPKKPKE